jgi:hypothetical protein
MTKGSNEKNVLQYSPSSLAALVHARQGVEDILGVDTSLASLVQLIGEDVEHEFTVAVSVDMSVGFPVEKLTQLRCVGQVAVVAQADAVRAVHIERLSLSRR